MKVEVEMEMEAYMAREYSMRNPQLRIELAKMKEREKDETKKKETKYGKCKKTQM